MMRSLAVTGMAALMLTGCNTLRGTGRDIQVLGEAVKGAGHGTAELASRDSGQQQQSVTTSSERWAYDDASRRSYTQQQQRYQQQQQQYITDQQQPMYHGQQQRQQLSQQPVQLQWHRIDEPQQQGARTQPLERATDLMSLDLVSTQGQYLGHIEQIVFDTNRGNVTYAIVSAQGSRYVVPWEAISLIPGRQQTLVLKSGPSEVSQQHEKMHSKQQAFGGESSSPSGLTQASTNDLIGMSISNHQGDQLGLIEDVVVDVNRGRAVFLLLSTEDPNQLAAVPFDAFQMQQQLVTRAIVPTDSQALQELTFRDGQRPFQDPQFARRVQDQFADRDPYWQVFAFPGGGPDQISTQQLETIRGTIESVGTFRDETGSAEGLRLRVRTNEGELVTVHAGPREYARQQGVIFNHGDEVMIQGARQQINGTEALVATEIHKGETLRLRDDQGRARWATDSPQTQQRSQPNQQQRSTQPQREQQQRTNQQQQDREPARDQADEDNGLF